MNISNFYSNICSIILLQIRHSFTHSIKLSKPRREHWLASGNITRYFVKGPTSNGSTNTTLFDLLDSMPKEANIAITELRAVRRKAKAAALMKPPVTPSYVYLNILGNGSKGNPRCLCVFTDHKRYIFNCGEGSQRLAQEHKVRLSKIEDVFFTYKSWENLSGLLGLTLTIQDMGIPDLTIHGPPDIEKLYPMAKNFHMTANININFKEYTEGAFEDNCFCVTPVPLVSSNCASNPSKNSSSETDSPKDSSDCEIKEPDSKRICLAAKESEDVAVAYVCKLFPKSGELNLEKCIHSGVPCGPLLGVLKSGKDVTLENGKIIRAADVVSPPEATIEFIVLECPSENFLDSLLSVEAFRPNQEIVDFATVVVHFTPTSVIKHHKYQEWLKRFPPKTTHLYLNGEDLMLSFIGAHRLQHMLNRLEPSIFPELAKPVERPGGEDLFSAAESLVHFNLRPSTGLEKSFVAQLEPSVYDEEIKGIPNFDTMLQDLHQKFDELHKQASQSPEFPILVFLGTGSAVPSKVRNVSSIIVEVSENSCILLDCGEGTYGQLLRFYGVQKTTRILKNLNTIFISHLHADHHMGLIELLTRRQDIFSSERRDYEPVTLIAPFFISNYLNSFHRTFQPVLHLFRLIPCNVIEDLKRTLTDAEMDQILLKADLKQISTVYVKHCKNAFGLIFTTNLGIKLVYSGDTMPCEALINAGRNCSILIHEATMEDDLADDALAKAHSTTSQAIEVGQKMAAQFTILTHFSQRYAKVPIFNENFSDNVGIAFDNMRVQMADLPKLHLLMPILKCMFHEQYEELQSRMERKKITEQIIANA